MADPANKPPIEAKSRKEKRKFRKRLKRKRFRKEAAIKYREEEEARLNDPEEQLRIKLKEQEEAEINEKGRREFEERERLWIEAANKRKEEEEEDRLKKILVDSEKPKAETAANIEEDDEWDYVEDGPPEIIWHGNEIIIKKKKVKVAKKSVDNEPENEDVDRPTSNPLPPQSAAFASYNKGQAQEVLDDVAQQVPNFGTEQDKAHCPFHLKTGACRFGTRCSRVHFYPDKSCTLLIKNMYNGPGLAWEQDEGLEFTDEEVEHSYEEFYEDVHTEFMKFGELVNFKVCRNGSYHLRGNVYVHYKSLESAVLAYNTMNGRYFAGKQLTFEFVGVMRWKIAICGEYMKTRLKTCSRGTACNFIHCFRNPGGDYEWADWDNPPPNYWVRRMADLFGRLDQLSHAKKIEMESFESPRDSNRKRTLTYSRRHESRRNTPYELEERDKNRDRYSSSNKTDRSSRRKETSFDDNHRTKSRNYHNDEHKPTDREITEKHKTGEDKSSYGSHRRRKRSHRRKDDEIDNSESHKRCKRSHIKDEISTDKHGTSESKHRSNSSRSYHISERNDDRSDDSSSVSSEEYCLSKKSNGPHDRYDGRYSSKDSDSDRDYYDTHVKHKREIRVNHENRKHEVSSSSSDESLDRRAQKKSSRRRI